MESISEQSALERAMDRLANVHTRKEDTWESLQKILETVNPILNPKAHAVIREMTAMMHEHRADVSSVLNDMGILSRFALWNSCEQSIANLKKTYIQRNSEKILLHQRWMIRRDMPEVLDIATSCSENAWKEGDFTSCLIQRDNIGFVAENQDTIVGYFIYERHDKYLQLLDLAVHPFLRLRSIGSQMIDKLRMKLRSNGPKKITAIIPETNVPMQIFLRRNLFQAVSVLRDYYDDSSEDAYIMEHHHVEDDV